jgi:hypothetical protein
MLILILLLSSTDVAKKQHIRLYRIETAVCLALNGHFCKINGGMGLLMGGCSASGPGKCGRGGWM